MVSLVRLLKLFVKPSNRREYWWGYYWNAAVFFRPRVAARNGTPCTVCHFVCLWPVWCAISLPLAGFVLCGFEGYIFIFAISCCGEQQKRILVGLLLECRGFFSATCGSSKRHTAPCAISSAFGLPSFLVQSAAFWAMCGNEMAHGVVCHFVCLWPASFCVLPSVAIGQHPCAVVNSQVYSHMNYHATVSSA